MQGLRNFTSNLPIFRKLHEILKTQDPIQRRGKGNSQEEGERKSQDSQASVGWPGGNEYKAKQE